MAKNNDAIQEVTELRCDQCNSPRFQFAECGTAARNGDTITVLYNELKGQCLDCHFVNIWPITGVLDYTT